ncbi:methyl-accepting chemotaxis protein [Thiomicrorhabdus sp. Kp2]|uniref:methyl-accepting chemotaxis protein n=1 Tax=Thiomicrorhabdus sp. Kp2 TaxID=1123518 RepID=UPI00041E3ED0|nr:methyl-accepting chemotaxis protein [Thiomicrorhabdus sp. Kp2]
MLANSSLKTKVLLSATIIGVVAAMILGIVIYYSSIAPIKNEEKNRVINEMTNYINGQINLKIQAGILGSTALSIEKSFIEALEVEEREKIIPIVSNIRDQFKNQTDYKNIQTQIITADGRAMMKSWKIDSYGQDLSNSPLIKNAMKSKQSTGSLAIGDLGVSIIAISPVISEGEMLGMITMIQGLASVRKNFTAEKNGQWLMLVDRSYVKERYGDMPIIDKNTVFNNKYIVANDRWFPKEVVDFTKNAFKPTDGKQQAVYPASDKMIIDIPALDEVGNVFGRHLFIIDRAQYEAPINAAVDTALVSLGGIILAIILLTFSIVIIVSRLVITPLQGVQNNMAKVVQTGDFSIRNQISSNDEVGKTSEAINQLLEQMGEALKEANHTVHALSQGDFTTRIHGNYHGDLEKLKTGVNSSAEIISAVMENLSQAMIDMRDGNYNAQISTQNSTGSFKEMLENAQQAFSETNQVISEINFVMMDMQQGKFDGQVNIEARGDLNTLKTHINESLHSLNSAIKDISHVVIALSDGDLTQTIGNQYQGDLLQLKDATNQSIDRLASIVSDAVQSGIIVNNEANSLSEDATVLSEKVQQQAAAIEETSATMEEMNAAVQNNTENALQASEVVEKVQVESEQASEVMSRTIEAMNSIQDSSNEIAEIVSLIDSIAFQTNLLALNAAVEAARAGEHGRGFAVVAGEVRALAQKSADAAKDIKNLIDSSVQRIDQGTKLASESGEVIREITQSIHEVASMIHQINSASQEQAEGVSQVHHAISDIDSATQANASLVDKTTLSANNMRQQASDLNKNMSFFKTNIKPVSSVAAHTTNSRPIPATVTANKPNNSTVEKKVSPTGVMSSSATPVQKPVTTKTVQETKDNRDEWAEF